MSKSTTEDGSKPLGPHKVRRKQVWSLLLANLYLHWFERAFHATEGPATWAKAKIVRYADDFVILARYQGPQLIDRVENLLEDRFELTMNREKSTVVNMEQPGACLDFLGSAFGTTATCMVGRAT